MIYAMNLGPLRVFLGMLSLVPGRSARDVERRWEIAEAIAMVTDDVREQDVLTLIARYESGYRADVSDCATKGDRGRSLGTFQVQPQTPSDARAACGSPLEQARLALAYVRRSAEACPGNVGADRLAMYVSGTCARGLREARHRWTYDDRAKAHR